MTTIVLVCILFGLVALLARARPKPGRCDICGVPLPADQVRCEECTLHMMAAP